MGNFNEFLRIILNRTTLVVIAFIIMAFFPEFAMFLLGNILGVFTPFLQPLVLFGVVVYGLRLILRGK